jgi:hypothetical protein
MKTDDLIALLANGLAPTPPSVARQRFQLALLLGGLGAVVVMLMGYGLRPDLDAAYRLPMFWVKIAFPLALAVPALILTARLSIPGRRLGRACWALPLPWLALTALAAVALLNAPAGERLPLLLGQTWVSCALSIALISVPVLAGVLWAMRGLAPTRPVLAGACAGLLSATVGTLVYALHCPEMQAPFLATWYVLGLLMPTAAGAWLGHRYLRW